MTGDETQKQTLVIFHGGCADGTGAAVAAYYAFGEAAEYRPSSYSDPPPPVEDIRGRDVFILDFSFSRPAIEEIARSARSLLVIDHHKTAAERLGGMPNVVIDQSHSGAYLAWRHFVGESVPSLIAYIEDRDLWRWQLPHSREVSAALVARGVVRDLRAMKLLNESWSTEWDRLVAEGIALVEMEKQMVMRMVGCAEPVTIAGVSALATNATVLFSEVGDELVRQAQVGITWGWDGKRKLFRVSLRSSGDVDVSQIASTFGGGGHRRAASFTCSRLPWLAGDAPV
jgi:oligoribonuclease NrnB/cAMP/cGMP phosphodiesterase (DHH superfamily)